MGQQFTYDHIPMDQILARLRQIEASLGIGSLPDASIPSAPTFQAIPSFRHTLGAEHERRAVERRRAKLVRKVIRERRTRDSFFPADLFADPAWDILLDLYAAHYEQQPVSVSSLCIAAAVPATTALRWIKTMTDDGNLEREDDKKDGRRIFIRLSNDAKDRMDRYFDALGVNE